MPLTVGENAAVRDAAFLASLVSAAGNLAVLAHTRAWRARNDGSRFRLRTIFFISATNLGQCAGFALGNWPVHALGGAGCTGQALLLQFSGLSTVLWSVVLSNGLWRTVKGDGPATMRRREGKEAALSFGLPLLSCLVLYGKQDLGEEVQRPARRPRCNGYLH